MTVPILIAVAIALFAIGLVALIKKEMQRQRALVDGMASRVGGQRMRTLGQDTVTGTNRGIPFSCRYHPGSKDSPPSLTITWHHSAPGKLVVTREKKIDRLAKSIGLSEEVQTHDPEFDSLFYLATDQEAAFRDFLSNRAVRQAISRLFGAEEKLQRLTFHPDKIVLYAVPLKGERLAVFPFEAVMEEVAILANTLPDSAALSAHLAGSGVVERRRHTPALLIGLTILLDLLGVVLLIVGLSRYRPLGASLVWRSPAYSLPAFLIFLWISFRLLKGRSNSHRTFLLLIAIGLSSFLLAGAGFFLFTNGYWDHETPRVYTLPVVDMRISRTKDSTSYYLAVPHWHRSAEMTELAVSRYSYEDVRIGDQLEVRIGPGYWSQEWLVGIKKVR